MKIQIEVEFTPEDLTYIAKFRKERGVNEPNHERMHQWLDGLYELEIYPMLFEKLSHYWRVSKSPLGKLAKEAK